MASLNLNPSQTHWLNRKNCKNKKKQRAINVLADIYKLSRELSSQSKATFPTHSTAIPKATFPTHSTAIPKATFPTHSTANSAIKPQNNKPHKMRKIPTQMYSLESELKSNDKWNRLEIMNQASFETCTSDTDYHCGGVQSIVVSPTTYCVVTGGKKDHSLRIWGPKKDGPVSASEITFVTKEKAFIDGNVLSVNMSNDGTLLAAGATLKNSVNDGYIVVWDLDDGNVLCDIRSRCGLRFGGIHCLEFMNYLLFAGDTNGCILCWNLSSTNAVDRTQPIAVVDAHKDIVNDLCISNNEWLFSVSRDQCLMRLNISGWEKTAAQMMMTCVFKDTKSCLSVIATKGSVLFGSTIDQADCMLKIRDNLMIIQQRATKSVKVFDLEVNKLIYDEKHGNEKELVFYDSGISCDKEYIILCVNNTIKGFKISK
eukprot:208288_1